MATQADAIPPKSGASPQWLQLKLASRHGLVGGSTGSGKAITLQVMAEAFSHAGVPGSLLKRRAHRAAPRLFQWRRSGRGLLQRRWW